MLRVYTDIMFSLWLMCVFQEVIVISGPAYLPSWSKAHGYSLNIKTIGTFPNLIHVPTHFFKVILTRKCTDNGRVLVCCAAFLIPNSDTETNEVTPLPTTSSSLIKDIYLFFVRIWNWRSSCKYIEGDLNVLKVVPMAHSSVSPFTRFLIKIEDLVRASLCSVHMYDCMYT